VNTFIEALVVGFLQGFLEWFPISSEGNLVLFLVTFFGYSKTETLDLAIFLHLGTGFAATIFFRREIFKILAAETKEYNDIRTNLFLMTILSGIVGFPIYYWLNISIFFGEFLFAITGLALIFSGIIQRYSVDKKKYVSELTWQLSLILGMAQGISVIPGISRSGLTTSILLLNNFSGEEAFRTSFLMSIPISFSAAFGLLIFQGFTMSIFSILSTIVSALIGYITINALLQAVRKFSFWKICIGIGVAAILSWLPNIL
jgi:undecaprenyl-diphosphatase